MNEQEFGARLKPWLERTAGQVGELQSTRLKAARLRALEAYRQPVRVLGLTVAAATVDTLRFSVVPKALMFLPIAALVATLALQSAQEADPGVIDAQLLTQELPLDAFLDQDFQAWLGSSRD